MESLKEILRKPLVKILTRSILYGLAAVFALLGADQIDAEVADQVPAAAEFGASTIFAVAAAALDKWHHRKDRAETPPAE